MADATSDEEGGSEAIVAEINITPLTDVFLVLLIIFMVTSTALVETEKASRSGVKVTLPKSQTAGPVTKRRTDPILTITKNNELFVFNKKVAPDQLEAELKKAFAEVGSDTLLIRGDKNVYLGAAVDIMSVARRSGAAHIAILTQAEEK
ncbi:MAG: biopolymer transporter ExbD [Deltaproteobacteria bacterium]|nr:biopolymer transporter ExbD [Deltaproteobacteria bacterium]